MQESLLTKKLLLILFAVVFLSKYSILGHKYFYSFNPYEKRSILCERGKWCKEDIKIPSEVKWHIIWRNCNYEGKEWKELSQETKDTWFAECSLNITSLKQLRGIENAK